MTRLRTRLDAARAEQRGVLMGFLPAGFPDPAAFADIVGAAFDAGLDALEVSMPGPAPHLDGPVIQSAARRASRHLSGVDEALALAAASRRADDDTIVALAYNTTLQRHPADDLLDLLAESDVDAVLLPEQTVPAQVEIGARARERGIEPVIFLHRQEDLPIIAAARLRDPVIYLQSADLRTGGTFDAAKARERLGELAEAMTPHPYCVCVGFGVRGADEIDALAGAGADGAIIGSRLVTAADEGAPAVVDVIDGAAASLVRW